MRSSVFFPVLFVIFSLFSCFITCQLSPALIPLGSPIRVGVVYSSANTNAYQTWLVGQKMYPALLTLFVQLYNNSQISGLSTPILNDGADLRNIEFISVNAFNAATPTTVVLADVKAATLSLLKSTTQRPHVLICPLGDAAEGCLLANEDSKENPLGPVIAIAPGTPNTAQFQCLVDPISNKLPTNCFRVGQRRFNYAYSILADGQRYFQPYVSVLRLANAKSALVITEDSYTFFSHVTIGALNALRDAKIDASIFTLPNRRVGAPVIAVDLAAKIVEFIGTLKQEPDAIFLSTQSCYDLPTLFSQINYAPKSIITVQCFTSGVEDLKRPVLKYHYIPIQWDPRLKGSQYSETQKSLVPLFVEATASQLSYSLFTNRQPNVDVINTTRNLFAEGSSNSQNVISSPAQFSLFYLQNMGVLPDYATGAVCAGFTTFLGALRLANSTNPQALAAALNSYYETSYYGLLTFNRYGYNEQREVGLAQYDSQGVLQIVAPLGAATASQIYPMPSWDDRVYNKKMYAKTEEVAMFIVVAIVGVSTVALMAGVLHYKKHPIIKAASWLFASIMGIGCIMAYLSILTWPLENDETTCSARHWFYTVPFHIFMDPLIAKSLRILRIFFADQFKVQKISDRLVALHSFLLFLPQLIINIAWSAMDAPSPVIKTPDPLRAAKNYTDCSGSYTTAFIAASLVYAMVIVTFGCIMAYKVRLTVGMFNDAKSIAMAIYMFSVPSVIIGAIQLFISDASNRSALFVLRSLGLCVSYFSAFTILYLPRLLDVYFNAPLDNVYRSSVQGKQNGEKGGSGLHAPLTPVRTVYMVPNDNKEKQIVNDKGGRDRGNSIGDKEDNGLINRESKSTAQSNNTTNGNSKDTNHLQPHRGSIGDRSSMSTPAIQERPPVSTLGGGGGGKLPMIPKVKSALTTKGSATTANNLTKPIQVSTITVNHSHTLGGPDGPRSPSTNVMSSTEGDSPNGRPKPSVAWNANNGN